MDLHSNELPSSSKKEPLAFLSVNPSIRHPHKFYWLCLNSAWMISKENLSAREGSAQYIKQHGFQTVLYFVSRKRTDIRSPLQSLFFIFCISDPRILAHSLEEVLTLTKLESPHIIRTYGHILTPNSLYLVMEYAELGSLRDYLQVSLFLFCKY